MSEENKLVSEESGVEAQNIKTNKKTKQKEKKPGKSKKGMSRGARGLLHAFQHIAIATAAALTMIIILGSFVALETKDGMQIYNLADSSGTEYEESTLFNKLLGKSVADIICYGAIRGQMETEGNFDPKKIVDTTAYANRYTGIQTEYITAKYYLEDLIKWSQNGFMVENQYMTGEEADDFLSRHRTVTIVNINEENYKGGTVSYLNSDLDSMTQTYDVSGNLLDTDEPIRSDSEPNIMQNRYHTVDGRTVENHVSSWEEYYELCDNIQKTANDLVINYNEYLEYKDYYEEDSNVFYYIRRTIGDNTQVFTNTDTMVTDLAILEKQLKNKSGRYIIYDPQNMKFDTNTLIEESTLRYVLNGYEYSYPEDTQILIGIDKNYTATDAFSQGKQGHINYVPYWKYAVAALFCIIVYFVLLILLTATEGRIRNNENGTVIIKLNREDYIPTEIMLIFGGISAGAILFLLICAINSADSTTILFEEFLIPVSIVAALICSMLFSFYYYSLVRRIKANTLWQNSMIKRVLGFVKKWVLYAYDHSAVLIRVWIPFVIFILLHIGLIAIGRGMGIIIILMIDLAVGILLYQSAQARQLILGGIIKIKDGNVEHKIREDKLHGDNLVLAQAVNSIGDGIRTAVATSMKDERLKADLITNVSHDIKTPLTSIINYVDLIKRENISNEKVKEYIQVLDIKSQRLKQLTDDLVEASKISSGNICLQWEKINLVELLNQTIGEFSEKFEEKSLLPIFVSRQNNLFIEADSRRIWRVIENLFNNIFKYALQGTRVYINIEERVLTDGSKQVSLSVKNISAQPLKVNPEELTERFIRGDESRTTEGSGLGLSIAKNLTEAQKGSFEIFMDGDLFKVVLTFPLLEQK